MREIHGGIDRWIDELLCIYICIFMYIIYSYIERERDRQTEWEINRDWNLESNPCAKMPFNYLHPHSPRLCVHSRHSSADSRRRHQNFHDCFLCRSIICFPSFALSSPFLPPLFSSSVFLFLIAVYTHITFASVIFSTARVSCLRSWLHLTSYLLFH